MSWMPSAVIALISLVWIPALFYMIGRISGWRRLARAHPRVAPAPDARRGGGSVGMGATAFGYNNCVRFATDDDHLHLALMPPFGWLFHPPISIPWAAVEFVNGGKRSRVFRRVPLRVGGVRIWVPWRVVEREVAVREEMAKAH